MVEDTWILFAGSMEATPEMLRYTDTAVQHAIAHGWFILMGDNPRGVDMQVLKTCIATPSAHYGIMSVDDENRSQRRSSGEKVTSQHEKTDYHMRDRYMVGMCDKGMFIWNERSTGTKSAHDVMLARGDAEVFLVTFDKGRAIVHRNGEAIKS